MRESLPPRGPHEGPRDRTDTDLSDEDSGKPPENLDDSQQMTAVVEPPSAGRSARTRSRGNTRETLSPSSDEPGANIDRSGLPPETERKTSAEVLPDSRAATAIYPGSRNGQIPPGDEATGFDASLLEAAKRGRRSTGRGGSSKKTGEPPKTEAEGAAGSPNDDEQTASRAASSAEVANQPAAKGAAAKRSGRRRSPQVLLVFRNRLLADSLATVLTQRFDDAGLSVTLLNVSEDQEPPRAIGAFRVLMTDRVDRLSLKLISTSLPADRLVCFGSPEDGVPPKKARPIREVLQEDTDIETVFTTLFAMLPAESARNKRSPSGKRLSPRETEVLRMLAEGATVREIAEELNLAPRTVENQKYRMMNKLKIRNTADLTRYAIRIGLVEP